jgi:hypothetical protein
MPRYFSQYYVPVECDDWDAFALIGATAVRQEICGLPVPKAPD